MSGFTGPANNKYPDSTRLIPPVGSGPPQPLIPYVISDVAGIRWMTSTFTNAGSLSASASIRWNGRVTSYTSFITNGTGDNIGMQTTLTLPSEVKSYVGTGDPTLILSNVWLTMTNTVESCMVIGPHHGGYNSETGTFGVFCGTWGSFFQPADLTAFGFDFVLLVPGS